MVDHRTRDRADWKEDVEEATKPKGPQRGNSFEENIGALRGPTFSNL